jgi:hypothetical protein
VLPHTFVDLDVLVGDALRLLDERLAHVVGRL